jgi:hypothetical protein
LDVLPIAFGADPRKTCLNSLRRPSMVAEDGGARNLVEAIASAGADFDRGD